MKVLEGAVKCFTASCDHSLLVTQRSSVSGLSEDKLQEVKALLKVGQTNRIASGVLLTTASTSPTTTDSSGMKARFSFETHSYFPIVSINRASSGS